MLIGALLAIRVKCGLGLGPLFGQVKIHRVAQGSNRAQNTANKLGDVLVFLSFLTYLLGFGGVLIIPNG